MANIYLSSTYEDLRDYRATVFVALRKAGHSVVAMEDYVASDVRPLSRCLQNVAAVDIYVGIIGFRYGYIPPESHNNPQGLSITELEYHCAVQSGKLSLLFLLDESTSRPLNFSDAHSDGGNCEQISRFRQLVCTEKIVGRFSSPHELASLVLSSISKNLTLSGSPDGAPLSYRWNTVIEGSPYPGLMHFTRRYSSVYFGRLQEVNEIIDRLHNANNRFLIISGDSGVGKSSLVDAGVIPRLEAGGLPSLGQVRSVRVVPSQGATPFDALARALHERAALVGIDGYELGQEMQTNPEWLGRHLSKIAIGPSSDGALVIFLDQMEELLYENLSDDKRRTCGAFLSALKRATSDHPELREIATLRSDYLRECHHNSALLDVLRRGGHYPIGLAEPYMLYDMIVLPARCANLRFSNELVRTLVREASADSGGLPLVAFVLQRLYEEREADGELNIDLYLKLGGFAGALANHTKSIELKLKSKFGANVTMLLDQLFYVLVEVEFDERATRRRPKLNDLGGSLKEIVNELVRNRLLTTEGEGVDCTVSVAHERLLSAWPALAGWIAANKKDLSLLQRAKTDAVAWIGSGFSFKLLWHADRIKELRAIINRIPTRFIADEVKLFAEPQAELVNTLSYISIDHYDRRAIGDLLNFLGDPRRGVGLIESVPDIDWVSIAGGIVKIEDSDFQVASFELSRFLVTKIQFEAFEQAEDGYLMDRWWDGLDQGVAAQNNSWPMPNYPRVNITWSEAIAFCRWLSYKSRCEIRLPSECEWQLAATGGDSNFTYPWGQKWDSRFCNGLENTTSRTSPVGVYVCGGTHQGVLDMVGNVEQWCMNEPCHPENNRLTNLGGGGGERAIRGGSFRGTRSMLKVANRAHRISSESDSAVGFRVCRSPKHFEDLPHCTTLGAGTLVKEG